MKRFLQLALVGALVLGVSSVVYANVCAFDPAPAATLLFPFVAFDYNNPVQGTTTLFAITNVSSEAQIVHVTLWSDDSIPVLDFNIVLSGFDLETVNIRDILADGVLPVTGTSSIYVVDGPAPEADGPVSHADGDWMDDIMPNPDGTGTLAAPVNRCAGDANPSNYDNNPIPGNQLEILAFYFQATQNATKLHNDCLGNSYGLDPVPSWWEVRDDTEPTWLYITADVVWECNRLFPDSATYWTTQALYDNVLIGDVFWLDDAANFSEADNAVHLEADVNLANVATLDALGNPISFYYRYSTRNLVTSDFREPLPTAWAFRYIGIGSTAMDTYIRAWKGSTFAATIEDLDYVGGRYLAYDCLAYTYWAWGPDEEVISIEDNPWSIPGVDLIFPNLLPLETQEVLADEFNTPSTVTQGWMLFVWPNSNFDNIVGAPAFRDADFYQTWMGVKYSAYGKYSAFLSGAVMANFNCFSDQVAPDLAVNYDYVDLFGYVSSPALVYTE